MYSERPRRAFLTRMVALLTMSLLAVALTLVATPPQASAQVAPNDNTVCYGLDEGSGNLGDDQSLHRIDVPSNVATLVGQTLANGNAESIAIRNETGDIYSYDAATQTMLVLNPNDGLPSIAWSGGLGDIDALFFVNDQDGDLANDELWGIIDPNELQQIDINSGAPIGAPIALAIPVTDNIEGATWLPSTGEVYISYVDTGTGAVSQLATVNLGNGAVAIVGGLIEDVEGLGVDGNNNMFLTTGEDPAGAASINTFYSVDPSTGDVAPLADLSAVAGKADFESIDCAYPDVELDKAVSAGPVSNGDGSHDVTYTFTVTNTGVLPLSNIDLVDNYDFTVGGAAAGITVGAPNRTTDTCTNAVLANGQAGLAIGASCTIVETVTLSDTDPNVTYDNKATVDADSPYPDNGVSDMSVAPVTIPLAEAPSLALIKTVVTDAADCPADFAAAAPTLGLDIMEISNGDTAVYCINVINTGPGNAINAQVTDDFLAAPEVIGALNAGAEYAFSYPHTVGANPEINTATVTADDLDGVQVPPDADDTDDAGTIQPKADLEIIKTVVSDAADCPADFAAAVATDGLDTIQTFAADTAIYCINVINNGPGDAVNVEVSDDFYNANPEVIGALAAGAEYSFDYPHTVVANPEVNTATVTGDNLDGTTIPPDSDDAGTTQAPAPDPDIALIKTIVPLGTACPADFAAAGPTLGLDTIAALEGSAVRYCINVINVGPGEAQNVVVTDTFNADQTLPGVLDVDGEWAFSYIHIVGTNPEVNTATVTAEDLDGIQVPPNADDTDDAGTTQLDPDDPVLALIKTVVNVGDACPADFAAAGATLGLDTIDAAQGTTVKYCINVINTGALAIDLSVSDSLNPNTPTLGSLATNGEWDFSYLHVVGANPEVNTATVTGDDEAGNPVVTDADDTDDAGTTEPDPDDPSLALIKTVVALGGSCPADFAAAGATLGLDTIEAAEGTAVRYCINVINTGPGVADNVQVTDTFNTTQTLGGTLAVDGEWSFSYIHIVGTNPEVNTATVTGEDTAGTPVPPDADDTDDAGTTEPDPDDPSLALIKTVVEVGAACPGDFAAAGATLGLDTIEAAEGTTVRYCINVINTGPGVADNVQVTDTFNTTQTLAGTLAVDGEWSFSYIHVVGTNPEVNTATVTGEDVAGNAVPADADDTDDAGTTEPQAEDPTLDLIKTVVEVGAACPGDFAAAGPTLGLDTIVAAEGTTVKYCINVINTGPGAAQNVEVNDSLNPNVASFAGILGVNGEWAYSYLHVVGTNPEVNTAVVSGENLDGVPATPVQDDAGTTEPIALDPDLVIIKTVAASAADCPTNYADALATDGFDTLEVATGQNVTYCILVRNLGPGHAQNVEVTDSFDPNSPVDLNTITAGSEKRYSYLHTVANNPETNVATVTGENLDGVPATPDTDDAGTTEPPAEIALIKTVVAQGDPCPVAFAVAADGFDSIEALTGTTVTYCINVANTGAGDALNVEILDDFDPTVRTYAVIAGGTEVAYSYSHVVGANPEVNVADLTAETAAGDPLSDSDDAGTFDPPPVLELIKTVVSPTEFCPTSFPDAAPFDGLDERQLTEGAIYCIAIINSGDGPAINVVIDDSFLPAPINVGDLAPGEEFLTEYEHVIVANPEVNTATVTGDDTAGDAVAGDTDEAGTTDPPPPMCNGFVVTIVWGPGAVATPGNDVILGTLAADTIDARGGDDVICGGGGADTIRGGPGDDIIYGDSGDDVINAGGDNDIVYGGFGMDDLRGGPGDDTIYGEQDDDLLRGDGGADTVYGGIGDDTVRGGPGDDELNGDEGDDGLFGGSDDDTLNGGIGMDDLFGQLGIDLLNGGDDDDWLRGGAGDDTLNGDAGNDRLDGNLDNDTLNGGADDDDLNGTNGDDILNGDDGNDNLSGGNDDDTMTGGPGVDICFGNFGFDSYEIASCETPQGEVGF